MDKTLNKQQNATDVYTVLPTVFIAKTRNDAFTKMALGEDFEAPRNLSKFNRDLIDFYMKKHNYQREKSRHGYDIYKPA